MNYETWRATFQSSEQAARAAYEELQAAHLLGKNPQVMGRVSHLDDGSVIVHLNSIGRALPDHTPLYTHQPIRRVSDD